MSYKFFGFPKFCFPKYALPIANWQVTGLNLWSDELASNVTYGPCWSKFNTEKKYYTWLSSLTNRCGFFNPAFLPPEPIPAEYDNLQC